MRGRSWTHSRRVADGAGRGKGGRNGAASASELFAKVYRRTHAIVSGLGGLCAAGNSAPRRYTGERVRETKEGSRQDVSTVRAEPRLDCLTFREVEHAHALLPAPGHRDGLKAAGAHAAGSTRPEVDADDGLERGCLVAAELEEGREVGGAHEGD